LRPVSASITREISEEATYQVRGVPNEVHRQIAAGWGEASARQIVGRPEFLRSR